MEVRFMPRRIRLNEKSVRESEPVNGKDCGAGFPTSWRWQPHRRWRPLQTPWRRLARSPDRSGAPSRDCSTISARLSSSPPSSMATNKAISKPCCLGILKHRCQRGTAYDTYQGWRGGIMPLSQTKECLGAAIERITTNVGDVPGGF
jgi:hypothetical protein